MFDGSTLDLIAFEEYNQPIVSFDYSQFDNNATVAFLHTQEVLLAQSVETIGEVLRAVKARLPHGEFLRWCRSQFSYSRATIWRKMNNISYAKPKGFIGETNGPVYEPMTLEEDREEDGYSTPTSISPYVETGIKGWAGGSQPDGPAGNVEWYTPSTYMPAIHSVLGSIDLDPASTQEANNTIGAAAFYDKADNGLLLPWHGRVFCNPPFGRLAPEPPYAELSAGDNNGVSAQGLFIKKFVEEWQAKHIEAAILLVKLAIFRQWFKPLKPFLMCAVDHPIKFYNPLYPESEAKAGCCFVYAGPKEAFFAQQFDQFGWVMRAGCY